MISEVHARRGDAEARVVAREGAATKRAIDPVVVICVLALLATVLTSAWRVLVDRYVPASDWALIEVQTRAVGSAATPLTGAWSRFGWNHPGPLLFYGLALPYRLVGGSVKGIQFGALLMNTASIGATLVILRRHGRAALVAGALGFLLVQFGLPPNQLRNEWNAAVPVFALVLLLVAAWDSWDGPRWTVVLVPLVATFVMQTHIAYVLVGAPAVAMWVCGLWRRRDDPRVLRSAVWGVAISALLWIPPILAVLLDEPGSLRRLPGWIRAGGEAAAGWEFAARLVGEVTSLRFAFTRGIPAAFGVVDVRHVGLAPGSGLLALALLVIPWRRDPRVVRFCLLVGSTWIVAFVAVARLTGPRYAHLVWWLLALSMVTWAAVALLVYRLVATRLPRISVAIGIVVVCLLVPATVSVSRRNSRSYAEFGHVGDAIVRLSDAARRYLGDRHEFVLDRTGGYLDKGAIQAAMMAYLDHSHIKTLVPSPEVVGGSRTRRNPLQFPDDRVSHRNRGRVVMLISGREALLDPPGKLIARSDPLTAQDRRDWLADYRRVRDVLEGNGRRDLIAALISNDVGFALLDGPPQLAGARDEIVRLEERNRRGPVNLLWVVDDPRPKKR